MTLYNYDYSALEIRLMDSIRKHRDQSGDDRCWQDDNLLYQVLPEGYTPPEVDEPVILENCKRYIERRQCTLTKYVPNLVEQAVHDLIARKAVHAKKGTVMGEETWDQVFSHFHEEQYELREAVNELTTVYMYGPLEGTEDNVLEELGDLYGVLVHAIVKAGFTVRQVEDRELLKLKERFPDV